MNLLPVTVPVWVSVLFIAAMPAPVYLLASMARSGALHLHAGDQKARQTFLVVVASLLIYFAYTAIVSFTGVFQENTLPPKVLLFTAIPFLALLLIVSSQVPAVRSIVNNITLESLVGVHIFRLIGVFFILLEAYGALPYRFAYVAGLGDIATAVGSIFVVQALKTKKSYATALVLGWNIIGLLDIISVLVSAILTTQASLATGSQSVTAIGAFPFCLIPALAPATIIFLHGLVFRKLLQQKTIK